MVHSHPFYSGEDTRPVCGDVGEESFTGGPSTDDKWTMAEISRVTANFSLSGYIIDGNRISKYNWKSVSVNNVEHIDRCGY